jgi:hypothetical protein
MLEQTPSSVIGQTERFRDIEEIGIALNSGQPISGYEQRRWQEAQKFKPSP